MKTLFLKELPKSWKKQRDDQDFLKWNKKLIRLIMKQRKIRK